MIVIFNFNVRASRDTTMAGKLHDVAAYSSERGAKRKITLQTKLSWKICTRVNAALNGCTTTQNDWRDVDAESSESAIIVLAQQ